MGKNITYFWVLHPVACIIKVDKEYCLNICASKPYWLRVSKEDRTMYV
jgi:hypothetical protein